MAAESDFAALCWEGDSRRVLASFPDSICNALGYALYQLQLGDRPRLATRRMESLGAGVYELKTSDERSWYRVIYLSRIGNMIYVLHCFEKRSRKTDMRDLRIAQERLARVRERIRKQP